MLYPSVPQPIRGTAATCFVQLRRPAASTTGVAARSGVVPLPAVQRRRHLPLFGRVDSDLPQRTFELDTDHLARCLDTESLLLQPSILQAAMLARPWTTEPLPRPTVPRWLRLGRGVARLRQHPARRLPPRELSGYPWRTSCILTQSTRKVVLTSAYPASFWMAMSCFPDGKELDRIEQPGHEGPPQVMRRERGEPACS